jgi:hypothetical protein
MRKPKDWGPPCLNPDWSQDRLMHRGHMSAISTALTQSGKRRLLLGHGGEVPFSATRDPRFFALRTPEEQGRMALKMLLGQVGLSDIGVVWGVTAETLLMWRERAAQQAHAINAPRRRALPVPPGPLDERWSCITRKYAQPADTEGESRALREDGRQGGWSSFAPEFRLLLAAGVGPRTGARAGPLIQRTAAVIMGVPCFCSAGFRGSLSALLEAYPPLKTFARPGKRGRPQTPGQAPPPDWVSGPVIKKKRPGRRQEGVSRGCGGAERREALGLSLRPRLIARLTLTRRPAWAPLVRQSQRFCKERPQRRRRVGFLPAFYNVARPPCVYACLCLRKRSRPRDGCNPRGASAPLAWPPA